MADGQAPGPGAIARAHRLAAGLSQQQLATLAGISVVTLRDLEQGRTRRPQQRLLHRLAAALRLDPDWAAGGTAAVEAYPGPAESRPGLWLRVLGPLAGWRDGLSLALGQPRQRAVLGVLAINAGRRVHRSELMDEVWGEDPPAAAVNQVQAYIGRLRGVLDAGRPPRDPGGILVSTGRSYALEVGAGELDWLLFGDLVDRAGSACTAGDPLGGCRLYQQALALWQGDPLADVDSLRGGAVLAGTQRAWVAAVNGFAPAAVAVGLADQALPHLWQLTERDPLNEKAQALLMSALVADGQQAAALRVFAATRDRLDSELGIRPGAQLSELQLRILREEIPAAGSRHQVTLSTGLVARQLPVAVRGFVGRGAEIKTLTGMVDDMDPAEAGCGTVVISAIGGAAGIGKTALAIHWAHAVAARFPDGQLYVDLRGFDPTAAPLSTAEAIQGFLDALRIPAQRVPVGVDAQAAMYRSLLVGRRVLVVLDNARDTAQVRQLLPASPGCLVVVTSRRRLTSLMAVEGARSVTVDVLSRDDAWQFLAGRLGAARMAAEPQAVMDLIDLCAGLPLALGIAAARCAARPEFPIAALVAQLRDGRQQLDVLSGGDAASDLRTLFSCSYQQLSPTAARLFRLLGRYVGPDISLPVAASLAALPRPQTAQTLDELAGAHLLDERTAGRFSLHDLLRTYAAELARRHDSPAEQRAAADRTVSHYLLALDAVDRLRYPASSPILSPRPLPGVSPEEFTDSDEALSWCQIERAGLAAIIGHAARNGPAAYMAGTTGSLWLYFHLWSHWTDLAEARRVVLTATRPVDTRPAAPSTEDVHPHDDGRSRYRRLVELGQKRDPRTAAAYCLFGLTQMLHRQGRPAEAVTFAQHALDWFQTIDDQAGAALALRQIGRYQIHLGEPRQAIASCHRALELCRALDDRVGEASATAELGLAHHQHGDYREAARHSERAAAIYGEVGDRDGRIDALIQLGDAHHARGDDAAADEHWRDALALLDDPGHPRAAPLLGKLQALTPRRFVAH